MKSIAWSGDWPITQAFDDPCCRQWYSQWDLRGHNGLDAGIAKGTALFAAEAGTISEVLTDASTGYGLSIYLTADSGYAWRYAHLSRLDVQSGERVAQGQQIGLSGSTGNSTGPHLHLGLRPPQPDRANGFGGYIAPLPRLLELTGAQLPVHRLSLAELALGKGDLNLAGEVRLWQQARKDAGQVAEDWMAAVEHILLVHGVDLGMSEPVDFRMPRPAVGVAETLAARAVRLSHLQLVEQVRLWQSLRTNLGQDPNDWAAAREHVRAISGIDPGPVAPADFQLQLVG